MDYHHVDCPYCGQRNENVYLEETDGLFECERCGLVTRLARHTGSRQWAFKPELSKEKHPDAASLSRGYSQKKAV